MEPMEQPSGSATVSHVRKNTLLAAKGGGASAPPLPPPESATDMYMYRSVDMKETWSKDTFEDLVHLLQAWQLTFGFCKQP